MKFANLLSKFYFETWGIRPEKHIALGGTLNKIIRERMSRDVSGESLAPKMRAGAGDVVGPQYEDGSPVIEQMQVGNGIAIIPVNGVMGKHLSFLELWCGGCDYNNIGQMLENAVEDGSIHTVIFHITSPGGMVVGLPELCAKLEAARGRVRLIAFADMECCSCAFWLASACDEVYFAPSAVVGCIGCYIAGADTSREWEMEGWKLELFRSGDLKGIGLDGKEWTEKERKFLKDRAINGGEKFKAFVRSRRGNVDEDAMQGQWFDGSEAPALGLCDRNVNELQDVVNAAMAAAAA